MRSLFENDFVSLDPRLKSKKSVMDRSFTIGSTEEVDNVKILQSCNSLLLCGGSRMPVFDYIYNPSTNQYKKLPAGLRIAFDPTKSPHYKLVDARRIFCDIDMQIYSSETSKWSLCNDSGSREFTIYETTIGCSVWMARYRVHTDDFMTSLPEVDDNHDDNDDVDNDDDDELLQQFQAKHNVYEFIQSFNYISGSTTTRKSFIWHHLHNNSVYVGGCDGKSVCHLLVVMRIISAFIVKIVLLARTLGTNFVRQHFDLMSHIRSKLWPRIKKGIEQHMARVYVDNKFALKAKHWTVGPDGTREVAAIRSRPPTNVKQADWDTQIDYWLDPKNAVGAAQNAQNQAKSKVFCRQGSRSLAVLQDQQMESSETREYPSLIQTFIDTHTYGGKFVQDEEQVQYGRDAISINEPRGMYTDADIDEIKQDSKRLRKELDFLRTVVRSDYRMSQLLTQLESQHEVGGGSENDGGGDDEPGGDEDTGGDEET
uniref:Uncharacterized protein n=1 Tax=Tanacetum cinerariifolium TaxID=118510 RepID=A0A6L2LBP1_TANCI|nr:hypothetical protein [Tanacetum cinerariifolium]